MKPRNTTEGSIEVVVTKVPLALNREKRKGQKKTAIFWG